MDSKEISIFNNKSKLNTYESVQYKKQTKTPWEYLNFIIFVIILFSKGIYLIFKSLLEKLLIKSNRKNITNNVVLITGAGNGLGREIAFAIASNSKESSLEITLIQYM